MPDGYERYFQRIFDQESKCVVRSKCTIKNFPKMNAKSNEHSQNLEGIQGVRPRRLAP